MYTGILLLYRRILLLDLYLDGVSIDLPYTVFHINYWNLYLFYTWRSTVKNPTKSELAKGSELVYDYSLPRFTNSPTNIISLDSILKTIYNKDIRHSLLSSESTIGLSHDVTVRRR